MTKSGKQSREIRALELEIEAQAEEIEELGEELDGAYSSLAVAAFEVWELEAELQKAGMMLDVTGMFLSATMSMAADLHEQVEGYQDEERRLARLKSEEVRARSKPEVRNWAFGQDTIVTADGLKIKFSPDGYDRKTVTEERHDSDGDVYSTIKTTYATGDVTFSLPLFGSVKVQAEFKHVEESGYDTSVITVTNELKFSVPLNGKQRQVKITATGDIYKHYRSVEVLDVETSGRIERWCEWCQRVHENDVDNVKIS